MQITLNSKIYNGIGFDANGVSIFSETSGDSPASFSKLTDKVNHGSGTSNSTVKWKLAVPVVAAEDSVCACEGGLLRTYHVLVEVSIPPGSTAAERADVYARLNDLVGTVPFASSIQTLAQAN